MLDVAVRRARLDDLDALGRLWSQVDRLHAGLQPRFFSRDDRPASSVALQRTLADRDRCLLVATVGAPAAGLVGTAGRDPRVVGLVALQIYDTPADRMLVPARRGHVEEIVVDEAHRQRGVGRALMQRATAWCRERGASQLLLTVWDGNAAAASFYQRLGYRVVNRVLGRELGQ